jgi:hypothetical protein
MIRVSQARARLRQQRWERHQRQHQHQRQQEQKEQKEKEQDQYRSTNPFAPLIPTPAPTAVAVTSGGSFFNFSRASEGVLRLEAGAVTVLGTIKAYEEEEDTTLGGGGSSGGSGSGSGSGGGGGGGGESGNAKAPMVPGLSSVFFRQLQLRFAVVGDELERLVGTTTTTSI